MGYLILLERLAKGRTALPDPQPAADFAHPNKDRTPGRLLLAILQVFLDLYARVFSNTLNFWAELMHPTLRIRVQADLSPSQTAEVSS
jgi:hypothetical protein